MMRLFLLLPFASALYRSVPNVKTLSPSEFDVAKKSGKPFLAQFYASWCGHSKSFVSEYTKVASAFKDILQVYAIDDEQVIAKEGIEGYPTVRFYGPKGAQEFSGERMANDVSTFVLNNLTKVVKTRLGVTKLSNSKNTKKPKKPKAKGSAKGSSNNGVIELDEGNFDSMAGDGGYWFVMFYAPWCGHCQNLEPTWAQLAGQLSGKVNVARVDATAQTSLAERFNVQGYPTLIMMRNQKTKVYRGARELDDLRSFALDVAKDAAKAVALKSNTHFEESCADSPCFVAILPQPEDLSSEERKQYLAAYNKAIQANASHNAKHFYMTGGNSLEFEQALNLGFGYPTLVVINKKRSGFGVMRGAFNEKAMTGFLRSSGALQALPPTLPTLKDEL